MASQTAWRCGTARRTCWVLPDRLWLIAVVLLAGAAAGAAVQQWRWGAADAERVEREAEAARLQRRAADAAAVRHEGLRAQLAREQIVLTREVDRVVEKAVYRAECFDADGLRIVQAAIGGDPGQPAPALPASAAAD